MKRVILTHLLGQDFLLVNVDDGDVPVSIDLRQGFITHLLMK